MYGNDKNVRIRFGTICEGRLIYMSNQEEFMSNSNQEGQNVETSEKKKRSIVSIVIEVLCYIAIFVFCIYVVPNYILQRTVVDGESMEATLHDGESLLVDKLSYRFSDPERYDIIVFQPKGLEVEEYYVKRIYGLPGETVQIKNNAILINGKEIEDPYAKEAMDTAGIAEKPFKLGKDEYFVLGDNRNESLDSRYVSGETFRGAKVPDEAWEEDGPGPIKFEYISGKVFLRIWPLSEFGVP